MSTILDAASIAIADRPLAAVGRIPQSITLTVPKGITSVGITVPDIHKTVDLSVPGVQGPPGLKNVYVQQNNPAVQFGWGPEQEGFIWARIV